VLIWQGKILDRILESAWPLRSGIAAARTRLPNYRRGSAPGRERPKQPEPARHGRTWHRQHPSGLRSPRSLAVYDHVLRHPPKSAGTRGMRRLEVDALAGSTYPLRRLGRSAERAAEAGSRVQAFNGAQPVSAGKVTSGSYTV
jgi:hypothetical protein